MTVTNLSYFHEPYKWFLGYSLQSPPSSLLKLILHPPTPHSLAIGSDHITVSKHLHSHLS